MADGAAMPNYRTLAELEADVEWMLARLETLLAKSIEWRDPERCPNQVKACLARRLAILRLQEIGLLMEGGA